MFDEYNTSTIINNSNRNIEVKIELNKETYKSSLDRLKNINGGLIKVYDTINMEAKYSLSPKEELQLDFKRGRIPNLKDFKKISIYDNDTIVLDNESKINLAFEKQWRNKFVLEIK